MITLTIGNSYSQITGLSPKKEKELKELLSYTVGGSSAYFSGYGVRKKSLLNKKGVFPTGLMHRILKFLAKQTYQTADTRAESPLSNVSEFLPIFPYPTQQAAVTKACFCSRGTISMPTGSGKSMVIAMIAAKFNLKTLVVVPSLEIKSQLEKNLYGLTNVTVENIASPKLKTLKNFDVLILDEAHHAAAKTYRRLNKTAWTGIYYRFCLTATPFRNDSEETLLFESIAGRVIYKLTFNEAVANKQIVPVEGYYIEIPKQDTDAYTYQEVYSELVVNNTARNMAITKLLTNLHSAGKSTLVLVKEVAHGQILADMTGLPFVSGADDASRRYIDQFNKRNIKVLIGTEGIIGEGVDTKPCEYVIIAGLGKAKSNFMQKVGRCVRTFEGKESGKVILIKDKSHKYLTRHFNAQKAILKEEYEATTVKLELE